MQSTELPGTGLSKKEAEIYLTILREGPCSAAEIAKKSPLSRPSIYDYLEKLIQKGFIATSIKKGKKQFEATDPKTLKQKFEEEKTRQERLLAQTIKKLSEQKTKRSAPEIEFYEGFNGLKTAMFGMFNENPQEIIVSDASGEFFKKFSVLGRQWVKYCEQQKIPKKILYRNKLTEKEINERKKFKLAEIKYQDLPGKSYTNTILYNDDVLIIVFDTNTPFAIIIRNKNLAKTYKNNFEILWKEAKPLF